MSFFLALFGIFFASLLMAEATTAESCNTNIAAHDYISSSNGTCAEICDDGRDCSPRKHPPNERICPVANVCYGYTCACYVEKDGVCGLSLKKTLPLKYVFCRHFDNSSGHSADKEIPLSNIFSSDGEHYALLWWPWSWRPWRRSSPSPSPPPPPPIVEATGPAIEETEELKSLAKLYWS